MLTRRQAYTLQNRLLVEAKRVLDQKDITPQTQNIIGGMLTSLATIMDELLNTEFFDE